MADIDIKSLNTAVSVIKMLSNPSRLAALCLMMEREVSVNELAKEVGLSQSALSQHLKILRDEGLVSVRRDHRTVYYQTSDEKLLKLIQLMKELYCQS